MIDEAKALGAAPQLRVDAVKALQQRWQAEAQAVPLDRKHEQKLWDAFRKPIDEAFNRKTEEREKAAAALSERDRTVLECFQGTGGGQCHRRRAEDQGGDGRARSRVARAGAGSSCRRGRGPGAGGAGRAKHPLPKQLRPNRAAGDAATALEAASDEATAEARSGRLPAAAPPSRRPSR